MNRILRGNSKSHMIVLMTAGSREEAENIARKLLNQRLIACANIIGPVTSLFWWKDRISREDEFLVLMKTSSDLFEKIAEAARQMHSYEVPEIIAVSIAKSEQSYLEWLSSCLHEGK